MSIEDPVTQVESCCPVTPAPLSMSQASERAALFKALADPVRLRLLALIAANSTDGACVCDLVDAFDLTQPTISHHLKILREAHLVGSERRGTWVYYWIVPDALNTVRSTLDLLGAAPAAADAT
ncbi:ArsR/SmtB family transcription factor [Phytoactinopolyspora halotolerans]|uniref:ArsR/SmtB family transcription factor n=1 Tax=Phytoactinopolyspora halotolerans TaxID=1981512 RepID=UPI0028AEB103|nr:metalloregulator ArsR/SmtB family transcription factor [Phytoactinopolyspora halotolerans]